MSLCDTCHMSIRSPYCTVVDHEDTFAHRTGPPPPPPEGARQWSKGLGGVAMAVLRPQHMSRAPQRALEAWRHNKSTSEHLLFYRCSRWWCVLCRHKQM